MLLHDKLRQLRQDIVPTEGRARAPQAAPDDYPGGRVLETRFGPCLLVEERFPLDHRHGRISLDACHRVSAQALALLAHATTVPGPGLERAVFLDTETTGLSGGSGTYVFLVGLGSFEQDSFVVRQLLMRDYGEEAALLEALQETLLPFQILVTFNGKSFDLPLLETRYVLARRASPFGRHLHLDLLHPARRLWRQRLENCRLSSVESVFGHLRADDIPSWMIPSLYFAFVRGHQSPMAQVLEHNRCDVLSLAALVAHLGEILDDPYAEGREAQEVYVAGLWYEEHRLYQEAGAAYAHAWDLAPRQGVGHSAATRLAALYKRTARPDLAIPVWEKLSVSPTILGVQACVELAKHFEHRVHDRSSARNHTLRALELLDLMELVGTPPSALLPERRALEHRLARVTK